MAVSIGGGGVFLVPMRGKSHLLTFGLEAKHVNL